MFNKEPNPNTCEFCPHRYGKGCPAWVKPGSLMETNTVTQEVRPVQGCFYQVIPSLMTHVIAAANRPAAVIQEMRNDMVGGMVTIAKIIESSPALSAPKPVGPLLEQKKDGENKK